MAEKDKNVLSGLFTTLLIIALIIVIPASLFFGVVHGVIKIIENTVATVSSATTVDVGDWAADVGGTIWNTVTGWLNIKSFSLSEYRLQITQKPRLTINQQTFNDMKDAIIKGQVSQKAMGLDDFMLKKMLLSYYRSIYLSDLEIIIELTDEEASMPSDKTDPFTVQEIDGKKYLTTTGMVTIQLGNTTDNLRYCPETVLDEIYQKYITYLNSDPSFADAIAEALKGLYATDGNGNIKMYVINTNNSAVPDKKYTYSNAGISSKNDGITKSEAKKIDLEYRTAISKYATPIEFFVDLMELTGSQDFTDEVIKLVNDGTSVTLGLYDTKLETTDYTLTKYQQETTVYANRRNAYYVNSEDGTLNGKNYCDWYVMPEGFYIELIRPEFQSLLNPSDYYEITVSTPTGAIEGPYRIDQSNNWYKFVPYEILTTVSATDVGNVKELITENITESKYELAVIDVNTWYETASQSNYNEVYTSLCTKDLNGDEVPVEIPIGTDLTDPYELFNLSGVIHIANSDEQQEYYPSSYPDYFYDNNNYTDEQTNGITGLRNSIFNYTKRMIPYWESYTSYTPMELKISRNFTSEIIKRDKTILTQGTASGGYNVDEFLYLLKDKTTGDKIIYPDLYDGETCAGDKLINGAEMLFELLDSSANTQNLTDIMKYILYRYSGIDYGVTSLPDYGTCIGMSDASYYSLTGSGSYEQFIRFLHSWEGGGTIYKNSAGEECYKICSDGGGGSAVGYGVDIQTHKAELNALGYTDLSIGKLIPVSVVDQIEKNEIDAAMQAVENHLSSKGASCTEYQKYALVSLVYNCGQSVLNKFYSGKGVGQTYKDNYTVNNDEYYKQKDKFNTNLNAFTKTFVAYNNNGLLTGRRKSELCLFETGYYGYDLPYNGHGMDEYWESSTPASGTYTGELYNADGSVNEDKIQELEEQLEKAHNIPASGSGYQWINVANSSDHCSAARTAVTGKYHGYSATVGGLPKGKNGLSTFQCTWWANGRASEYLGRQFEINGNGGDIFKNAKSSGKYNTGITPKPNSLLSTTGSSGYGHVLYIEAVDNVNHYYYASEAGSGYMWGGIHKYRFGYHTVDGINYGFVYLD